MSAGRHVDGKNVIGSYSALAVFETGKPFCGGFYVLPQYHLALDIRQGDVHATQDHRSRRKSHPGLEACLYSTSDTFRMQVSFFITKAVTQVQAYMATVVCGSLTRALTDCP